jgi:tRNA 5-methylaminomethyl-2-thiouridine biosynthesis bifunctional protein
VHAALASRGLAWSVLGARTLAAWIAGAPFPLESSLVDAIDPARFVARGLRKPVS